MKNRISFFYKASERGGELGSRGVTIRGGRDAHSGEGHTLNWKKVKNLHFFVAPGAALVLLLPAARRLLRNALSSSMHLEKLGLSAGKGAQHFLMSLAMAGGIWPSLSPMET